MSLLLLTKLVLAPVMILIASVLGMRLGPRVAGLFIGLPATAIPFMLTMYLTHGEHGAVAAARGSLSGQVVCALFCILYARTTTRLGPVSAMLAAVTVAALVGFTTVGMGSASGVAALALATVLVGVATWPPSPTLASSVTPPWSIPLRMVLVAVTIWCLAAVEPHLGTQLAGACASLPLILMVMAPTVHWTAGEDAARSLADGTLRAIGGTVGCLLVLVLAMPVVGLWPALAASLAVLWIVNRLVPAVADRVRDEARRPARPSQPVVPVAPRCSES